MATTKSGSTRVSTEKLVKTCHQVGLTTVARAGWILAFREGEPTKRLLIHTGKKGTNCIEMVGFGTKGEFGIKHPCPPAKTMWEMIDCNQPAAVIYRNFYKTCRLLAPAVAQPEPAKEAAPVQAEAVAS